ncbi:MAG TPA: hypothetical protein VII12_16285 [Thermoanaerobaculia bacterium]
MIRYLGQLFASMGKHLGEPALALVIILSIWVMYVGTGAKLPVVSLILGIIVFQFGVASWRLYHRQQVSIATKQGLLELDEVDRVESEQNLRKHYEHREESLNERHEAYVKSLVDDIAGLSRELVQMRGERA